jgi:hypothetical protein
MASHSLERHGPDTHHQKGGQEASTFKCIVSFTSDEVRVVVEQATDAADRERYNSGHRQCLLHMVAVPPTTFDCDTSGKMSAPCTEVILQRAMLEKLCGAS